MVGGSSLDLQQSCDLPGRKRRATGFKGEPSREDKGTTAAFQRAYGPPMRDTGGGILASLSTTPESPDDAKTNQKAEGRLAL